MIQKKNWITWFFSEAYIELNNSYKQLLNFEIILIPGIQIGMLLHSGHEFTGLIFSQIQENLIAIDHHLSIYILLLCVLTA